MLRNKLTAFAVAVTLTHAAIPSFAQGATDRFGYEQPPAPYYGKNPAETLEVQLDFAIVDSVCSADQWHRFHETACARRGAFQAAVIANARNMPALERANILAVAAKNPDIYLIVLPKVSWPGMTSARQAALRTHEWGHACFDHNSTTGKGWLPASNPLPWCKTISTAR